DGPLTLYAKWIANDEADYTILIWKQDISGTDYDFEESIRLTGDVGAEIDTVSDAGTGNDYHAVVNGTAKTYTGFHLNSFDTGVQIVPEGTTVLNVYYDRDVITLNYYLYGTETNYIYTETTGNTGTQYGVVDGEYVPLTYENGTWYYNTGQAGYSPTTSNNGTQYGLVNGEYVRLTRHGRGTWLNPYSWTYETGEYTYTATNSNNTTPQYGIVNGEYVELTKQGNNWYYNGERYRGQRYIRSAETATYSGTRYVYRENALAPYIGIRYTRESSRWALWDSYSGLYGSTLEDNGYDWPNDYNWYSGHDNNGGVSGTRTTFMDAFLPSNGLSQQNFYGQTNSSTTRQVIFYKQNADLNGYTEANRVATSGGTFNISDKYNGFKAYQYRVDGGNWQSVGTKNETTGYYGSGISNYSTLEIRFNRLAPSINYMDGAYFYRAVTNQDLPSRGQLHVVENINYGADLSSYNKGGSNYYEPTYEGYVLEGWYTDSSCSQPYTFTTMPEGGITVYAKWVEVEYRVFLHSNVPQSDTSLTWGDDSMCFRVAYKAMVSGGEMKAGLRQDYEIIGWYRDEACTQSFNFATVLTDDTVTAAYDKTTDMTDPIDKYGVLGSEGQYNSDIVGYNGGDRFWITRKLDLYAKWRSKLAGNAKGISVEYDANGGSNAPVDNTLYLDQAEAYAGAKSTPPAGSTDEFKYWIVQQWDESQSKFVDTGEHVYENCAFTVRKLNAHEEDITPTAEDPDVTKKYTVRLKAFYGPVEVAESTFIRYEGNGGTLAAGFTPPEGATVEGNVVTFAALQVNATHTTLADDTYVRDGYTFLGWAQSPTATVKEFDAEQDVAADNLDPTGNTLYAVWEEEQVTLNYVAVGPEGATGFGSVAPASETLGAATGVAAGSTASVGDPSYSFIGWYDNAACTGTPLSRSLAYAPTKEEGALWVDGTTYYAKFDHNTTTLTIRKNGMADGESAIFTVTGPGYESGLTVAVPNGGSVTIGNVQIGATYTVVEMDSWSWRYSQKTATSGTLTNSGEDEVSVTNTKTKGKWLSGSDWAVNTL
ncbi:MAG: InlB B-repeat-containing protein, partial [Firmicutes bacterium]|nr:InlB B-repeat-containing protein [Bacillota bacterium]